jgi:hypothetical protein
MNDSELYTLIQSDPAAVAAYNAGDDDACALRCSVIAPTVRRPVPAEEVQAAAIASGLWAIVKIAAQNTALPNPPRGAAMSFVDWIEAGRPIDMDGGTVQGVGQVLLSYNLATQPQLDALQALANVPQAITQQQIGAAREWHRATGGASNGTA